eukprot:PDM60500.1 ribosomal protein [Pristionchus pacificus]
MYDCSSIPTWFESLPSTSKDQPEIIVIWEGIAALETPLSSLSLFKFIEDDLFQMDLPVNNAKVNVADISLVDYITVKEKYAKYLPHSAGRYQAMWLLGTGAHEAAFRNIKTIAECLADELINAAKESPNNYTIKKKDEPECVAHAGLENVLSRLIWFAVVDVQQQVAFDRQKIEELPYRLIISNGYWTCAEIRGLFEGGEALIYHAETPEKAEAMITAIGDLMGSPLRDVIVRMSTRFVLFLLISTLAVSTVSADEIFDLFGALLNSIGGLLGGVTDTTGRVLGTLPITKPLVGANGKPVNLDLQPALGGLGTGVDSIVGKVLGTVINAPSVTGATGAPVAATTRASV